MIVFQMLRSDIQRRSRLVGSKTESANRSLPTVSPGRSHTTRKC